jgi:non-heme chloroperoxidase
MVFKLFEDMLEKIEEDRPAFLTKFGKQFYGVSMLNWAVSEPLLNWNQMLCLMSSHTATTACVRSFSETDFRQDLLKINVPTLIIHGDADKTVPINSSGNKTAHLLPHAKYIVYPGAPHGLFITEKDRLNKDLIDFIGNRQVHILTPEFETTYSRVLSVS